jgi:feruloyl esterase
VAEDPRRCRFDVASLLCKGAKQPGQCLTPEQVAFARRFYAPLTGPDGKAIDQGLLPGVLVDSGRSQLALGTFGRAIRHQSDWNGADFDLARDHAAIDRVMPELRADKADLSAFSARGGKAILYSGWMDPAVAARMMLHYDDRVVRAAGGKRQADAFLRLYMMPGMFHCRGGPGPDEIGGAGADGVSVDPRHDMLSALEAWVERGQAPGTMIAAKVEHGAVVRTRPVCPYPQHARYLGHGSTDDAAHFACS